MTQHFLAVESNEAQLIPDLNLAKSHAGMGLIRFRAIHEESQKCCDQLSVALRILEIYRIEIKTNSRMVSQMIEMFCAYKLTLYKLSVK